MTAKKWTADQKLVVVLAGLRNEGSTTGLCRRSEAVPVGTAPPE